MSVSASVDWKEQVSSRYRVIEQIGISDHSVVYKAHDDVGDLDVALKIVPNSSSDERQGGMREVSLLLSLDHHHLVNCLDIQYLKAGGFIIVYEYVNGGDLRTYIERNSEFGIHEWCKCATQLFSALDYLRSNEVVHCDLKPENILISLGEHGKPQSYKIADFGVARFYDAKQLVLTKGTGSPAYMAPEAFSGRPTFASDVYSIGIILYELAVGSRPFAGSVRSLARAHAHELPDLSMIKWDGVRVILSLLLQKQASHRLSDSRAVLELLSNLSDDSAEIVVPSPNETVPDSFSFVGEVSSEEKCCRLDQYQKVGDFNLRSPFSVLEPVSLSGKSFVLVGGQASLSLCDAKDLSPKDVFYYTNGRRVQVLRNQGFVTSSSSQVEVWNSEEFNPQLIESLGIRVGVTILDETSGQLAWSESSKLFVKEIGVGGVVEVDIPRANESTLQFIAFRNGNVVLVQGFLNPLLSELDSEGNVLSQVSLPGPIIHSSPYGILEFLCWDNSTGASHGPTIVNLGEEFELVQTHLEPVDLSFNRFCQIGSILSDASGRIYLRSKLGEVQQIGECPSIEGRRIAFSFDADFYYVYSESEKDNRVEIYSKERNVE